MVLALRAMGAKYVDYLVPNRFKFGYGLTPEIVDVAIIDKKPDLIITVDNGISSREGVERAKEAGVKVLITVIISQVKTYPLPMPLSIPINQTVLFRVKILQVWAWHFMSWRLCVLI